MLTPCTDNDLLNLLKQANTPMLRSEAEADRECGLILPRMKALWLINEGMSAVRRYAPPEVPTDA